MLHRDSFNCTRQTVPETDGGDGGTAAGIYVMPLKWTLKMVQTEEMEDGRFPVMYTLP